MTSQITIKLSQAIAFRDLINESAKPLAIMFVADTIETTKVNRFIVFFMYGACGVFIFSSPIEMPTITAFKTTFPTSIQVEIITA